MYAKTATVPRTIYTDFLRFMLASIATGMVAAMLLSGAVILMTAQRASVAEDAISLSSGEGA